MHSMSLSYSKENESGVYGFANETVRGDAVPPNGGCWVYKWVVPESAAPNYNGPATMHGYHSYVSMQEDLNAGLLGPQITYRRGKMNETMARYREFPVLLQGIYESKSMFAAVNARREGRNATVDYEKTFSELRQYGNETVWKPQMTTLLSSLRFSDAPTFHAMNGYVLGNLPTFEMSLGDEVIWFVYGMSPLLPCSCLCVGHRVTNCSGEGDAHSFHLQGHGFTHNGIRMTITSKPICHLSSVIVRSDADHVAAIPDTMATLYMNATMPGNWQVVCHI